MPAATSARDCLVAYDLDAKQFSMLKDGQTLTGAEAAAESKRCLSRSVMPGGDALGRQPAPIDVAAFLTSLFETKQ